MKVVLPSFLLTHEDYLQIEVPPVKNFVRSEKERSQLRYQMTFENDSNGQGEDVKVSSKSRKLIIILIVLFLVAVLGVGIFFALNL